jgi:hypothetical protein
MSMQKLEQFRDESLKHVVLGGHGNGQSLVWGSTNACGKGALCIDGPSGEEFLRKLSRKMHRHGSIFVDSCHSATFDDKRKLFGMNLAEFVAATVRNGVRVIGSAVSFDKVRVQRFVAWHAKIDADSMDDAQRLIAPVDAQCPEWADSVTPNRDGDCQCPSAQRCQTTDGKKCPSSNGHETGVFFVPMCAESWAKVQCCCVAPGGSCPSKKFFGLF